MEGLSAYAEESAFDRFLSLLAKNFFHPEVVLLMISSSVVSTTILAVLVVPKDRSGFQE